MCFNAIHENFLIYSTKSLGPCHAEVFVLYMKKNGVRVVVDGMNTVQFMI